MIAALDSTTSTARAQHASERGRTTVTRRALDRLVSAVTAEAFGVTARAVHVNLSDRNGLLALDVRTPVRIAPPARVRRAPTVAEANGGTLIERAGEAQTTIRERVSELSGAHVAHVTVQLTGIQTHEEGRVT